jgi:hypothetical protein
VSATIPDGTRFYGDGGTIHGNTELDVEVDRNGKVVAVWFRCSMLPFRASVVDERRAEAMRAEEPAEPLAGVVFRDEEARQIIDRGKSSAVMPQPEEMVRVVRRAEGHGYWVQSWRRSVAGPWFCREQRLRLTRGSAVRLALSWPGPLNLEPQRVRERSAR